MARYSLTDNEFKAIEALITYSPERGRRPTKIREMFDAILWILCSGAPWRDLPEHYPPYQSVYHRFRYYQKHGILEQVSGIVAQVSARRRTPGNVRGNGSDPERAKAACVKMIFNGETWTRPRTGATCHRNWRR